jgi:hypothetical protein
MFAFISQALAVVRSAIHPFDIIYQAAKEKNAVKIASALLQVCIDVRKTGPYDVPVSQLATEGNIDAVNFLREKFNASLKWMAYGYARGGHTTEAGKVLALAAHPGERLSILNNMAYGYAQSGYTTEVAKVLKLAASPVERTFILSEMAAGYARGGYSTDAGKLLGLAASPAERAHILDGMAAGYARGGYSTDAGKVLELVINPAERASILNYMAYGHTVGGHTSDSSELGKILKLAASPAEHASILNYMAYGYALAGHSAGALKILELASPAERAFILNNMASGYTQSCYITEAGKVLQLASPAERTATLNAMVLGYIRGGYTTEAGKLLELAASPAEHASIFKNIVQRLKLSSKELSQSIALRGLATANNDDTRTALVAELKESKVATTYDIATLIPRAKKISQVMAMSVGPTAEKLNYAQGLAWTQPELPIWFLQCVILVKNNKLSSTIFLSIAAYLSPLSINEATLLVNRLYVHTFAGRFFRNLSNRHRLLAVSGEPYFDSSLSIRDQLQASARASSSSSCSTDAAISVEKKPEKCSIM